MINTEKENKFQNPRSGLILGILFLIVIAAINCFSFFSPNADQFNLFHHYKEIYPLETWNIPSNVEVDINSDGFEDRITWTGCLILLGQEDNESVSKQYTCEDGQMKGISVFNIEKSKFPQIRLSYVGKTKNNAWEIVLIKNLQTEVFGITKKGDIFQIKPPLSLQVDTLAYFLSHLFVIIIGGM